MGHEEIRESEPRASHRCLLRCFADAVETSKRNLTSLKCPTIPEPNFVDVIIQIKVYTNQCFTISLFSKPHKHKRKTSIPQYHFGQSIFIYLYEPCSFLRRNILQLLCVSIIIICIRIYDIYIYRDLHRTTLDLAQRIQIYVLRRGLPKPNLQSYDLGMGFSNLMNFGRGEGILRVV